MTGEIKEDLISKLPVELLHKVFYWLPTKDVFIQFSIQLSHANQALRAASLHRDFKLCDERKEGLELTISQCGLGYMIEGGTAQAPYRSFYYQIFPMLLDPEVLIEGVNDKKIRMWKDIVSEKNQNYPKPEEFLDDVPRLLKFFKLRMLTFDSIIFDAAFLDNCQKVFKGIQLSDLSFKLCADLLNPLAVNAKKGYHMERIIKWIESVKTKSIFFGECSSLAKRLIDEKFLTRMSAAASCDKENPLKITISAEIIRMETIAQSLRALWATKAACRFELTRGKVLDREFDIMLRFRHHEFVSQPTANPKWWELYVECTDDIVHYSEHHVFLIFENFDRERK